MLNKAAFDYSKMPFHKILEGSTVTDAEARTYNWKEMLKQWHNYPKKVNAHNSLQDAMWNKQLHEFLNSI
jgi:hypothetical protein